MINFQVDKEKCTHCGLCSSECPVLIIDRKTEFPTIKEGKEQNCLKCQHCLAVCPEGAISIWGKNPEDSLSTKNSTPEPIEMEQLIKTRRSIRKFKKEAIDKELIHRILETAAHAPSSKNENGVLFTVVDDKENLAKLRTITYDQIKLANDEGRLPEELQFLSNFQNVWETKQIDVLFRDAPHLLIASAPESCTNPESDACIALSYFELLANSNGIGTLWDGFARWALKDITPMIKQKIGIPDNHVMVEVMLFGKSAIKFARSIQSDGLNLNRVSL